EWEAAQNRPGERRSRSATLLSGVLSCGSCGRPVVNATGAFYGCRRRQGESPCPRPVFIRRDRADAYVEAAFLDLAERERVVSRGTPRTDRVKEAVAALEAAEAEVAAYRDAQVATIIGRQSFLEGLRVRQAVVDDARAKLAVEQRAEAIHARHYDVASLWTD